MGEARTTDGIGPTPGAGGLAMAMKRDVHVRPLAVLAVGYLVGLIAYSKLPGPFLDDHLVSRVMVAFGLPTTGGVIYALFRSLWMHDRIRSGNGVFEATFASIVFRILLFVTSLHVLVTIVLVGVIVDRNLVARTVVVLLGLSFIAVGNLLPRTRPNVAVGVRTRLTLANSALWTQVHRVGGYVTVCWGAVIAISAVSLSGPLLGAVISGAGIASVAILFVSYRKYAHA